MGLDREKIRAHRERMQLTMQEAGERFGAAKGTAAKVRWYQIEAGTQGNPSLETIEGVCRVLGVGIDQILTDDSPAMPRRSPRRRAAKASSKP
jgi:transcriptional regulator with XRE-family HTH domain